MGKKKGNIVVAFPGNGVFAQQVALALLEHGLLDSFVTTFAFRPDSWYSKILQTHGGQRGQIILNLLRRRSLDSLPGGMVGTHAYWEVCRSVAVLARTTPPTIDRIWDIMAHDFTRHVAAHWVSGRAGIYAYEYTALEAFERAKSEGVPCILDLPSLSSREFEGVLERERLNFPETKGKHDRYFAKKFECRQQRRDREISMADVIMTNSSLTARSHIAYGADPERIVTVPLAAPPAIDAVRCSKNKSASLKIVWAGNFSIGKGAHYFLNAWRALNPAPHAIAYVYGAVTLPAHLLEPLPVDMNFFGSVPQAKLFDQFEHADVLIFPTLSDGFGMVVNESFAHGLPVITTDRAGSADLVKHGQNGLIIEAGKAESIRDALQWCMDNREQLRAMRFSALETATNWQWGDYRAVFIEKLRQALQHAGYSLAV